MRYDYELKMKAVIAYKNGYYLDNPGGCKENSWKSNVREWTNQYDAFGEEALKHKTNKLNYDEKLILIAKINSGNSIRSVAEAYNVSRAILGRWYHKYSQNGIDGVKSIKERRQSMPKPKETSSNKEEKKSKYTDEQIEYILAENAYLKKLQALVQEKNLKIKKK